LALPDSANGNIEGNSESGELAEAEELVKEKVVLIHTIVSVKNSCKKLQLFDFTFFYLKAGASLHFAVAYNGFKILLNCLPDKIEVLKEVSSLFYGLY
jgi:hypothetical protein